MIPDIDTQLASVIKSLGDNVLPAIDSQNQLAQEQLYLAMATLKIVRENLPFFHEFVRCDLREHVDLCSDIIASGAVSGELASISVKASEVLCDPELGSGQVLDVARQLREQICKFLADENQDSEFDHIVLKHAKAAVDRGRAWTKGQGFEPNPDEVPELSECLNFEK